MGGFKLLVELFEKIEQLGFIEEFRKRGKKLEISQIITLISGAGLGAIISAILVFLNNSKKNQIDYITKERAEWRKQLKIILENLKDSQKKDSALIQLKSQINPFGKNMDIKYSKPYYMKDGHIWDILDNNVIDYDRLSLYIALLLKYDWERSKKEIKFNPSTLLRGIIWFTLFILSIYSSIIIYNKTEDLNNDLYLLLFIISIVSIIFVSLQIWVTNLIKSVPSRHKKEQMWIFIVFYAFPYANTSLILLLNIPFLNSQLFDIFSLIGLFVYEFFYLSTIESLEDDYVKAVERISVKRNFRSDKVMTIYKSIDRLEKKVYGYSYNQNDVEVLRKKYRKLQKKLIKKLRPSIFIFHPILYIEYQKKKYRISKIVKILLTNN